MDNLKTEPDVEIIDDTEPDEKPDALSQVTVDLDKKAEPKATETPKQAQPRTSDEIQRLNNTIAYQTRKLEQAMRELHEVKTQLISRPQTVQQDNSSQDEIDQIAQRDWKQGVKKVVEKDIEAKVQEILFKRDEAMQQVQRRVAVESELARSKQLVLSKYPAISDDSSEQSSLYRQVLNEDSSLLSNVHGPEIAMYRMEEKMRQMGQTPASSKPIVDREVNRLVRAGASSVVGKTQGQNNKITLTKEQKEFCDHYKIPYEQYARNLKATDAIGGVEA